MSASDAQLELLKMVHEMGQVVRDHLHTLWEFRNSGTVVCDVQEQARLLDNINIVLSQIGDMLQPKDGVFWKLKLGQRHPGKRTVPAAIAEDIHANYHLRTAELYEAGAPAPKKTAIGELAKEYGTSDKAIREIVRRATGKKTKRKPPRR
jgi:hypothetical protein